MRNFGCVCILWLQLVAAVLLLVFPPLSLSHTVSFYYNIIVTIVSFITFSWLVRVSIRYLIHPAIVQSVTGSRCLLSRMCVCVCVSMCSSVGFPFPLFVVSFLFIILILPTIHGVAASFPPLVLSFKYAFA